jgi:hypothetical protein
MAARAGVVVFWCLVLALVTPAIVALSVLEADLQQLVVADF